LLRFRSFNEENRPLLSLRHRHLLPASGFSRSSASDKKGSIFGIPRVGPTLVDMICFCRSRPERPINQRIVEVLDDLDQFEVYDNRA
jgi:hypothetical protein